MIFALGVIVGGAVMYYIQPTIKDYTAKAFGWEQSVYESLADRAAALKASENSKKV